MKTKLLTGIAGLLLASSTMFGGWRVGYRGYYHRPWVRPYIGAYVAPAPYVPTYIAPGPYVDAYVGPAPFYGAIWTSGRWAYGPHGRYWARGYWGHRR
ncbi:MAG: hypothetical protein JOY62_02805 [Acidobacteriaceae bacterium]|nr:hypothetical protein [Acidobacteriaceae bacterium]MBV9778881.1 hypothetical protein [Acidobacteriaceae bacterium]